MNSAIESILINEKQISTRVNELASAINADYSGKKPIVISVLKGSVVFFSDLIRKLDLECSFDFIVARSYGINAFSSGTLEIIKDIDTDINGRDVIIVEDILDTGVTLSALVDLLSKRSPLSIKTVVLLDKNLGIDKAFKSDYTGFFIKNEFVVGYGLDYAENYRNLPYIGILKKDIYKK